jgi:hypothetical protein
MRMKCGGATSCMNHTPTRNCKGTSSSTPGKMSRVSRSKNSQYVGPVNRSGRLTGPISRSPTIPAQTFIEIVVWCLASQMVCGFARAQICTLWKLKIPSCLNIASLVNKSFHRNCGCWTHRSKHHWQSRTRRGKSSSLRPCTLYRWYGYSRSSSSILQRVLRWTPSAEDILRVLVPGLSAMWARNRSSCCTALAVRGLPPSITGMNVPLSRRRFAMRENVRLHGSRRFGNVSWYRRLASCALPLARP